MDKNSEATTFELELQTSGLNNRADLSRSQARKAGSWGHEPGVKRIIGDEGKPIDQQSPGNKKWKISIKKVEIPLAH